MPASSPPPKRTPLTQARIIEAASRLIERDGIEALSMRTLAGALGVGTMSLYNHVPNKEAVLDGVAELVLTEMDVSATSTGSWEDRARALARAFRELAVAHPRAFPLVLTRQFDSWVGLRPIEQSLGVLRFAGFEGLTAVQVLRTFVSFETGSLMRELGATGAGAGAPPARRLSRIDELDPSEFPEILSVATELATPDHEAEYEFGLELLILGVAQLRTQRSIVDQAGP